MVTIGERSDIDAKDYFLLYKTFKVRYGEEKAKSLALHDLYIRKTIAEFAIEKLEKMIKEEQK